MLNPNARKRLHAIEKFSMLGAGFQIALRDLEIRGAGNLLGAEQSGHIAAVGYEMYCQLLEQAVRELREGKKAILPESMIDIGSMGRLPEAYIASPTRRLDFYRRLATCQNRAGMKQVIDDLESGYGQLPIAVTRLVQYHELRIAAGQMGIISMTIDEGDVVIRTKDQALLCDRMESAHGTLRTVGVPSSSGTIAVYYRPSQGIEPDELLSNLHTLIVCAPVQVACR